MSDKSNGALQDDRHRLKRAAAGFLAQDDIVAAQREQLARSEIEMSNARSEFLAIAQRVIGAAWAEPFRDIRNMNDVQLQNLACRVVGMMRAMGVLP